MLRRFLNSQANVLTDLTKANSKTPQFSVSLQRGFLPITDPLIKLPAKFSVLESLLQRMPLTLPNGSPGLLAQGKFGRAVLDELEVIDVDSITDTDLLTALFRDYTFAASSYLLEPCDINMRTTGSYGLGRSLLPKQLAIPLSKVSQKIGAKPFMEYAMSYSLYNYRRAIPNSPLTFPNLRLIRSFQNSPSENGFILVHVAMAAYSGHLVSATLKILEGVEGNDRTKFDEGLGYLLGAMKKINKVMDTMWVRSMPSSYMEFRTFIMGTKNQPMFPNGVIYEGVSTEPTFFRGESGANDSIIPTCDNVLGLTGTMPSNPLTLILKDFRSYRPVNHNEWLSYVEAKSSQMNVKEYSKTTVASSALYLAALDQVREFRNRHWSFTKHTKHPVATGGSPIVTWLPNQLAVVLDAMTDVHKHISQQPEISGNVKIYDAKLEGEEFQAMAVETVDIRKLVAECGERALVQRRVLIREVEALGVEMGKTAVDAETLDFQQK